MWLWGRLHNVVMGHYLINYLLATIIKPALTSLRVGFLKSISGRITPINGRDELEGFCRYSKPTRFDKFGFQRFAIVRF